MNIPKTLHEAFDMNKDDVFTLSDEKGLTYTARIPDLGIIEVLVLHWTKPKCGALWEHRQPEPRMIVSLDGKNPETLEGQDELAAWISLIAAGRSSPLQWQSVSFEVYICTPSPGVLLRVMPVGWHRRERLWGFCVAMPGATIGHDDCVTSVYHSAESAKRAAEYIWSDPKRAQVVGRIQESFDLGDLVSTD